MVGPLTEMCSSFTRASLWPACTEVSWLWLCDRDPGQYRTSGSQTVCNADHKLTDRHRPADIFLLYELYGRDHFDPCISGIFLIWIFKDRWEKCW